MRYDERCPICNSYNLEKVHQDSGRGYVEKVLLCGEHELVVEYGEPIVTEVRDSEGKIIPESEWE